MKKKDGLVMILMIMLVAVAVQAHLLESQLHESEELVGEMLDGWESDRLWNDYYYGEWLETKDELFLCEREIDAVHCECSYECPGLPFEEIAENVASENGYHFIDYNCVDFTDELVSRLKERGYEAYKKTGWYDGDRHSWSKVCVNIESTNGQVLDPWDYNDYYWI